MHCFTVELAGECLKCLFRLTRGRPTPVALGNRKHGGRVSQRYRFESRRGDWALFSPHTVSSIFRLSLTHTHTHTHTHMRGRAIMLVGAYWPLQARLDNNALMDSTRDFA